MDRKFHFLLAGNGSYVNRGCEAIVRGTTTILRKEFKACHFFSAYAIKSFHNTDAKQETDPDITHLPILRISRFNQLWWKRQVLRLFLREPDEIVTYAPYMKALKASQKSDAVLLIGGDNFTLDYGYPEKSFGYLRRAQSLEKPVVLWGASVGPFSEDPDYEEWAAKQLRTLSLILVRESATFEYLKSIGVEKNVRLVADPAFLLEPHCPSSLPVNVRKVLDEGCIGLNFSPLVGRYYKKRSDWVTVVIEGIKSLLERFSMPILLIPHVFSDIEDKNDIARDDYLFMKGVIQSVRVMDNRVVLLPGQDLGASEVKWVIGHVRLFAGARTHSTIAAISSGVPTICIGYSAKARGITQDVYGHLKWMINGKNLDPNKFSSLMVDLDEESSTIRDHLASIIPEMKFRAIKAGEYLRHVIR